MKFKRVTSIEEEVFPHVCSYDDYHEVGCDLDDLKKKFQIKGRVIMGKEIAFDGNYWGLYWIRGQKPSKEDIRDLLVVNGFCEDLEHAEFYEK